MGQRFQILVEVDGNLALYRSQWLWGEFAIRRMGSFVWAIQEKIKKDHNFDAHREISDVLRWAFLYKLLDQNHVSACFDDEIWLSQEILKKEESIRGLMNTLDNNNGQFYLKIKNDKIAGYAFYNPLDSESPAVRQGKLMDYKEYMLDYGREFEKFDKEQKEEYVRGCKIFDKLNVLEEFPDIKNFIKKKINVS